VSHKAPHAEEIVIEAGRIERQYWRDLWRYRELFYILAWRDISVRYKQTAIGITWAVIQPLLTMLVLCVIFGMVARLPSEGNAPYALLVLAGMLPWQFFASAVAAAGQSLVTNSKLISKVYFPRMIIPVGAVVTSFVDFVISLALLAGILFWFRWCPDWRIVTLPIFAALAFVAAIGPGLLITALNIEYRDFRYVIPFMVQFGLYVSPVGYSSALIRERFGDTAFIVYSCNPMVGIIDGFRWSLLAGEVSVDWPGICISVVITVLFAVVGIWYFRRVERTFADVV